jgi:hypothetical protein
MISFSNLDIPEQMAWRFPERPCCNCGCDNGLKVIMQDTRLTRFFGTGGSELRFQLALPFCERCQASAKRRPRGLLDWLMILMLLMPFYVLVVGLVRGDAFDLDSDMLTIFALACATLMALIFRRRPVGGQSSFSQPVGVTRVRRKFLSDTLMSITFSFTHEGYKAAFEALNAPAIASGLIKTTQPWMRRLLKSWSETRQPTP